MQKLLILCIYSFLFFTGQVSAATQSMCKDKVLDTGTVEGVYLGTECVDMCYAGIKLSSGEELYLICGEEEGEKFFGAEPGRKVSATYEVQQFWNEYAGDCARMEICTGGRVLDGASPPASADAKPSPLLARLFTPKMLGTNILYIEKEFGPAMRSQDNRHEFEIDGCRVIITGDTAAYGLELHDLSSQCSFDLAPLLQMNVPMPVFGLTFGAFDAQTYAMGQYTADCLSGCGNAYVPSVYESYEGSRSTGFLKVRLGVKLDADSALEAARIWEEAMVKAEGRDWVDDLKFVEDGKYNAVAGKAFKNVPITSILLGHP